jgi:hydroxyacylglutathione hydrolase
MAIDVHQFLCLKDNYGALMRDRATGAAASIDAPDGAAVIAAARDKGWKLTHALVTHHHADHTQGLPALRVVAAG